MLDPRERQTLGALRYAVNEEAASYLAIMRLFTAGMSGFLSDQSADEVAERLAGQGFDLDRDVVDQRLSYLVEHGTWRAALVSRMRAASASTSPIVLATS